MSGVDIAILGRQSGTITNIKSRRIRCSKPFQQFKAATFDVMASSFRFLCKL